MAVVIVVEEEGDIPSLQRILDPGGNGDIGESAVPFVVISLFGPLMLTA